MKSNFTLFSNLFFNKVNKKNTLLIVLLLMSSFFIQTNAQTVLNSGHLGDELGSVMTGNQILYVNLTPQNTDGTGLADHSFALSQDEVFEWVDYSALIRMSSLQSVDPSHPNIDFRNDVGFDYGNDTTYFEFGETYEFWIEVSISYLSYNVYLQTKDMTEPVEVATDMVFRRQDITELAFWSVLSDDDYTNNAILVENLKYVDAVGNRFATSITSLNSNDLNIYPNPTQGTLNIKNPSSGEFSYELYSITGEMVAKRNNITDQLSKVDMGNLTKGIYLINLKSAENSTTQKVILK